MYDACSSTLLLWRIGKLLGLLLRIPIRAGLRCHDRMSTGQHNMVLACQEMASLT